MGKLSTACRSFVPSVPRLFSHVNFPRDFVKVTVLVLMWTLAGCSCAWTQNGVTGAPAIDVLGAHNSGRGCMACHTPHNDLSEFRATVGRISDNDSLWGQSVSPDYKTSLPNGSIRDVVEAKRLGLETENAEVAGVLLCLSCHDGNITPQNMMATRSYAQKIGLLPFFRGQSVLTPIDENQQSFLADHPVGSEAKIETGYGLEFSDGVFSVKPRTPYAYFVASYGWPSLAPLRRSNPYGIDGDGQPYLVCTTCHNQHIMNTYVSQPASPIAGDGGAQLYRTFFFVNGPYNPTMMMNSTPRANSAAQFCRQCHFHLSNEGNNGLFIPTWFQ